MQIRKSLLATTTLLAVLAAVPTTGVWAADWYFGAGVGRSDLKGGATSIDPNVGAEGGTVISLDDKSTGWKVFGGYRFNQNWAAEAIYAKFGKFSVNHTQTLGTAVDRAEPDALCLAGVGILPLSAKWSLLGKAGVCHWNDHPSESESTLLDGERSTGTDPMFGAGASYSLTKRIDLRGEWERYQNVVHNHGDVDLFSASLSYRF